jgi:Protein of unknown function (DUF2480)
MADEITNKVANSGIITFDLEEYYLKGERVLFDIKPLLFQELILKEKDFRDFVKDHDWSLYQDKFVAITCTADAIIPTWAFMLVSLALEPYAKKIVFGDIQQLETILFHELISNIDISEFEDKRVVVKGCGKLPIPLHAYVLLSAKLKPAAKSIMFGEPCSTVPLYKKPAK